MNFVLGIIALIVGILGALRIADGQILWGILLIVAAFAIGPGGWSLIGRNK